jgi:hypothetical protein
VVLGRTSETTWEINYMGRLRQIPGAAAVRPRHVLIQRTVVLTTAPQPACGRAVPRATSPDIRQSRAGDGANRRGDHCLGGGSRPG